MSFQIHILSLEKWVDSPLLMQVLMYVWDSHFLYDSYRGVKRMIHAPIFFLYGLKVWTTLKKSMRGSMND